MKMVLYCEKDLQINKEHIEILTMRGKGGGGGLCKIKRLWPQNICTLDFHTRSPKKLIQIKKCSDIV